MTNVTEPRLTRDSSGDISETVLHEFRKLRDKDAITELTVHYNMAWDDGLTKEWVGAFTADGVFAMLDSPDVIGAAALHEFGLSLRDAGFMHTTTDHLIEVDGNTAKQTCRLILSTKQPGRAIGTSKWVTTGRYTDDLVRTEAGWRFARRYFVPDAWWATDGQ
ncbi:MAG: nuclear transport factor 2 family protein [Hyphomicrobiales bacterium]|nr:MAG: nuclear transport factor 2 family protein [Hyphomicrobiales bacterium]